MGKTKSSTTSKVLSVRLPSNHWIFKESKTSRSEILRKALDIYWAIEMFKKNNSGTTDNKPGSTDIQEASILANSNETTTDRESTIPLKTKDLNSIRKLIKLG